MAHSERHVNVLDRVVGHARNVAALRGALEGDHFPHALLFAGPEGVGKRTLALAVAAHLVCRDTDPDSLWEAAAQGHHPDVVVLAPEQNKKEISIDQVRAVEERIGAGPLKGRALAVLIDPADKMNIRAANAILKTLEEPPEGTYFFLVTTAMRVLPQPVISRCQVYRFGPLTLEEMRTVVARIRPELEVTEEAYELSSGSVSEFLSLSEEGALRELLHRAVHVARGGSMADIIALSEEAASLDGSSFERLLRMMLSSAAVANRSERPSPVAPKWRRVLTEAISLLKINVNKRLLMERVLWQLRKG